MQNSNSRNDILQKIAAVSNRRLALVAPDPIDSQSSALKPILPDPISCFKNELEIISGQFILCDNEQDIYAKLLLLIQEKEILSIYCRDKIICSQLDTYGIQYSNLDSEFENMQMGITGCEFLIARTGSVLISSDSESGRQMNVFPPIHIVLAHISQLVNFPTDALIAIQEKYDNSLPSMITTITGPSRTADIEKTLVLGAHGPKEFIVFLSKE